MYWITDEGSEQKTIFQLSLRPNGGIVERYTDTLATTFAKDVFSLNLNSDCLVTVKIQLYVGSNSELFNQSLIRELAESADINILCDPRASFPIGPGFISGKADNQE